jgi:hypothetical protein
MLDLIRPRAARNTLRSPLATALTCMLATGIVVATPYAASAVAPASPSAQPLVSTTTTVTSSCAPGRPGPIVLAATVRSSNGTVPTGLISFSNGSTVIGSAELDSSGRARITPKLTEGRARITAAFPGAPPLGPSTSQVLNLRVGPGSTCMVRERSRHGTNNSNNNNNAGASRGGGGGHHKRHHRF